MNMKELDIIDELKRILYTDASLTIRLNKTYHKVERLVYVDLKGYVDRLKYDNSKELNGVLIEIYNIAFHLNDVLIPNIIKELDYPEENGIYNFVQEVEFILDIIIDIKSSLFKQMKGADFDFTNKMSLELLKENEKVRFSFEWTGEKLDFNSFYGVLSKEEYVVNSSSSDLEKVIKGKKPSKQIIWKNGEAKSLSYLIQKLSECGVIKKDKMWRATSSWFKHVDSGSYSEGYLRKVKSKNVSDKIGFLIIDSAISELLRE